MIGVSNTDHSSSGTMELSERVYGICGGDERRGANPLAELKAFFDAHPGEDVNLFCDETGTGERSHYTGGPFISWHPEVMPGACACCWTTA
jgi:hypothetical protein